MSVEYITPPPFKLNSGALIPAIGFGTWQSAPGEVRAAVSHALTSGYTHIDAASAYANEAEVGQGIVDSGVDRSKIWVTSKLWCTDHRRVKKAVDESLEKLGVGWLDLYLIHWPVPLNPNGSDPKFPKLPDGKRDLDHEWSVADTWKQMEAVLATGKVKNIGVSNFSQDFLEELLKTAKVVPATDQIELHPYLPQTSLVAYLKSKNILPQAYSPLGSTGSPLMQDPTVVGIAKKLGVTPGAVLLSYPLARGIQVLAKSVTAKRIEENLKVVKISEEDVKALDGVGGAGKERFVKPDWNTDLKFEFW